MTSREGFGKFPKSENITCLHCLPSSEVVYTPFRAVPICKLLFCSAKRFYVCIHAKHFFKNPKVTDNRKTQKTYTEGCASVPKDRFSRLNIPFRKIVKDKRDTNKPARGAEPSASLARRNHTFLKSERGRYAFSAPYIGTALRSPIW